MFFGNSKKLVALDIGTSSVKMAEIDWTSKGPILKKFGIAPLNKGTFLGGEILEIQNITTAIDSLAKATKTKRKLASTGMGGNAVIVKKIAMPKMEAKLVAEQIRWEAEQYIPFDINEVSIEYHILKTGGSGESMDVLLVAAKQEFLFRFIESIEAANLKCAVVDVTGFALANCFEVNYGRLDQPVALVNLGASSTNFVVIDKGEVTFNRDMSVGGLNYTTEINTAMGVSLEEAEALKISASLGQEVPAEVESLINNTSEQVIEEIKTTFEFYRATSAGDALSKFYISGGSVFIPNLVEQISKAVNIPFEPLDPFQKIKYDQKAFTPDYIDQIKAISPIAIGLALRKVDDQ